MLSMLYVTQFIDATRKNVATGQCRHTLVSLYNAQTPRHAPYTKVYDITHDDHINPSPQELDSTQWNYTEIKITNSVAAVPGITL